MRFLQILLMAIVLSTPSMAQAGTFDGQSKILLHVGGVTAKNACAAGTLVNCADAIVSGDIATPESGPYYFVYLLAARGDLAGLSGFQVGLTYEEGNVDGMTNGVGLDIYEFVMCARGFFGPTPSPLWPRPGSGTILTWDYDNDGCQTGDTSLMGYFYVGAYSPDTMTLIPRPIDGVAKTVTCDNEENVIDPDDLGFVAFSPSAATPGCNPCLGPCEDATPTQRITWSGVKARR